MVGDLNDARFFAEIVAHGSFTAAARAARVPVSTVSRRLARLEARLGVGLVTRTTRKLALTDAGRLYHEHAVRALDEIDTAERLVQDLRSLPRGRVRLTAPRGIVVLVWPALVEFLGLFPEVSVDVHVHEQRVHLVDQRYDLALWTGSLEDSSAVARKLLDSTYQLFASPTYLAKHGAPRSVADLERHECVTVGGGARPTRWALRQGRRTVEVSVRGRIGVTEMGLVRQAALDGQGIGKLPATMVVEDVAEGRLARVLPNVDGGPVPAWLIRPAHRDPTAAVRSLADHLVARVPALYAAKSLSRRVEPRAGR